MNNASPEFTNKKNEEKNLKLWLKIIFNIKNVFYAM